jgi:hypothetical protein
MRSKPQSPLLDACLILDIEASGLHPTSFPIEIAWTGWAITTKSFLIKPDASWAIEDWDEAAEDLHHISLADILRDGVDAKTIINALLSDAAGKTIISDGVSFDQNWLNMLFDASEQSQTIKLQDSTAWLASMIKHLNLDASQVIDTLRSCDDDLPIAHRAAGDVERLFGIFNTCLLDRMPQND